MRDFSSGQKSGDAFNDPLIVAAGGSVALTGRTIAITASILGAQAIGAGCLERLGAITRAELQINLVLTGDLVLLDYLLSRRLEYLAPGVIPGWSQCIDFRQKPGSLCSPQALPCVKSKQFHRGLRKLFSATMLYI